MIQDVTDLQSADDVLRILNGSPSHADISQCLRFFERDAAFDIRAPGALQTRILSTWTSKTLPDLHDTCAADTLPKDALLKPLSSIPGLGAILTRLAAFQQERPKKGATADKYSAKVLLNSLDAILSGSDHIQQLWSGLWSSPAISPTQRPLLWKEYVALTAGGNITNICARYSKEELGTATWLAEGSTFSSWLGRLVGQLSLAVFRDEAATTDHSPLVTQLCSRSLSFGYVDRFLASLVDVTCLQEPCTTDTLSRLHHALRPYEQRKLLDGLLALSTKRYLANETVPAAAVSTNATPKELGAVIALLQGFAHENKETLDQLCDWLTDSQRSSNAATATLRAVVAAVSQDQDKLEVALAKIWEQWANQLFIRHAPTAQQNTLTQALLIAVSYAHRAAPMYLFTMARSSVHTHGLSNRLASSSPRARWLGMVAGMAVSALADKGDNKLVFDVEDMQTDEARWYRSLTSVDDKAGTLSDLPRLADAQTVAVASPRESTPKQIRAASTSKKKKVAQSPVSNALIEPAGPAIPSSLRIVELDDTDYLIPHAKPDSDPEDDNEDATMVNRKRPKAPIYIRDLIRYLLDSENIEQRTLALQTAPALIRRKSSHGKEVTDHLEELATVIAGLNDGDTFDVDDEEFARLRQRSLQAVLVTDAKKMGPWFAKAVFNVTADYSAAQRMGLLIAVGLGGRELAGYKDGNDGDEGTLAEAFPSKRLKGRMHEIWATAPKAATKAKKLKPIGRAGLLTGPSNALAPSAVDRLVTDLERTMLEPLALDAADHLSGPDILKVRKFSSRMDVERNRVKPKANELSKIVAQAFFFPLTGYLSTGVQTRATGSSASFNKYLLPTYLRTLALLLHSAGPSTPGFATLVAEFWGLLLSLRSAAAAVPPALEALLFSLLTILELNVDRQEDVVRDHAKELIETQEWARMILDNAQSGGGEEEEKVHMLAAGVAVRCSEVVQKYQRRLLGDMVDM